MKDIRKAELAAITSPDANSMQKYIAGLKHKLSKLELDAEKHQHQIEYIKDELNFYA